jgi:hypothetical protein
MEMMHELDAWNSFFKSGSIYDYLVYRSVHNDLTEGYKTEKTEKKDEDFYGRTDNQATEYR